MRFAQELAKNPARPRELSWPLTEKQGSRDVGAADLRHRAKRLSHHAKDKQRFVVSVVAYDSLPGHQSYDILHSGHLDISRSYHVRQRRLFETFDVRAYVRVKEASCWMQTLAR